LKTGEQVINIGVKLVCPRIDPPCGPGIDAPARSHQDRYQADNHEEFLHGYGIGQFRPNLKPRLEGFYEVDESPGALPALDGRFPAFGSAVLPKKSA
jgi:hypothetical protein